MTIVEPASRRRRLFGWLTDGLLVIAFLMAVSAIFFVDLDDDPGLFFISIIALILSALVFMLARDLLCGRGVSPGKYIVGLQVRDFTNPEQVPGAGRLILRNVPVIIFTLEAIAIVAHPRKRRLGDMLTHSTVVSTTPRNWGVILGTVFALLVGVWMLGSLSIKRSNAYEATMDYARTAPAVVDSVGEVTSASWFPQGHVSWINGVGESEIRTSVFGPKGSLLIKAQLKKNSAAEPWTVESLAVGEDAATPMSPD